LTERGGGWFLCAPSLTAEEAIALARAAALAQPPLRVGVITTDRQPGTFITRGQPPVGRQVVFDALRSGFAAARTSTWMDDPSPDASSLSEPADVAFIIGHSNGFHADAAVRTLSVCRENAALAPGSASPCFDGDDCAFAGRIVTPRIIGARRVVAVSCWGVRLDDLYDRRLSIGNSVLALPQLESYVTTVRVIRTSLSELAHAYFLVNQGLPFGEVANALNRARLRAGLDVEYLCFGNPASVMERSLVEVRPTSDENGVHRVALKPGEEALDLEIPLQPAPAPCSGGHVLRVHGQSPPTTAFVDGDRAYMSWPAGVDRPTEIRFTVDELARLQDFNQLPAALLSDVAVVESFFEFAPGLAPAAREELRSCAGELRRLLVAWPFFGRDAGDYLRDSDIAAHVQQVSTFAERLSVAALAGYLEIARNGGPGGAVATGSIWPRIGRSVGTKVSRCGYCNSISVENRYQGAGGFFTRSNDYCDRCGLIHDRDSEQPLEFLTAPRAVPLGSALTLTVPIENPYSVALGGYAIAALQSAPVLKTAASSPTRMIVPPGERATISLRIPPGFHHPGGYILSACTVVGARISFFRSHVRLERADA
jgi:hypothetical protein